MNRRRAVSIALLVVVLVVFVGAVFQLTRTSASFFEDLWYGISSPFGEKNGTSSSALSSNSTSDQAALYKPTINYEQAVVDAVKKASPAVVSITVSKNVPILENCPYSPFSDLPPEFQQFFGDMPQFSQPCDKGGGTKLQEVGGGSGFIISSDGMILTNKHVVEDAKASYTVFTNDGKKYDAKVLARDPVQDLAIIKIDGKNLSIVELGDSDSIELGQSAIAIGNALGEFRNTVSVGVISGLRRNVTAFRR